MIGLHAKTDMFVKAVDVRKRGTLVRKLFDAIIRGADVWQGETVQDPL